MKKQENNFISDGGKYTIMAKTETMAKNIYDADRILYKLGVYDIPTDKELIQFLKDLEEYFYGNGSIKTVKERTQNTKDVLSDLGFKK